MIQISEPGLPIGKLLAAPVAMETLNEANVDTIDVVERHIRREWGDVSDDDKRLNDLACTIDHESGWRIFCRQRRSNPDQHWRCERRW